MIKQFIERAEVEMMTAFILSENYSDDIRYHNIIADHISCSVDMVIRFILRCHGIGFALARQSITAMTTIADYNNIDLMLPEDIISCIHLLDLWNVSARADLTLDISIDECVVVLDALPDYIDKARETYYYVLEQI